MKKKQGDGNEGKAGESFGGDRKRNIKRTTAAAKARLKKQRGGERKMGLGKKSSETSGLSKDLLHHRKPPQGEKKRQRGTREAGTAKKNGPLKKLLYVAEKRTRGRNNASPERKKRRLKDQEKKEKNKQTQVRGKTKP